MNEWLSKKQIETFALELITPEFINRVVERCIYLHNTFDKNNSVNLIDKMIEILNQQLNEFSRIINNQTISLRNDANRSPTEQYKHEMDIHKAMREGTYKRKPLSEEEIETLRNTHEIATVHFVMYHIQGVKGKLKWNDINKVIEQVKEAKETISINSSNTTNNNVNKKQKDNFVDHIRTLDELLEGKLEIYAGMLKTILEREEKRVRILSDNSWIKEKKAFSIVIAWMDSLQQAKKFKISSISDEQKSHLINKYFKDFDMKEDESSLWRKHGIIYTKYGSGLTALNRVSL